MTHPTYRTWTETEDAYLKANFGIISNDAIATHLGRPALAVPQRAFRIGIKKADVQQHGANNIAKLRSKAPATSVALQAIADKSPMHGKPYTCPELQRNPGIPGGRFIAFDLPSRVGGRLHYPDGRVEVAG